MNSKIKQIKRPSPTQIHIDTQKAIHMNKLIPFTVVPAISCSSYKTTIEFSAFFLFSPLCIRSITSFFFGLKQLQWTIILLFYHLLLFWCCFSWSKDSWWEAETVVITFFFVSFLFGHFRSLFLFRNKLPDDRAGRSSLLLFI